MHVGRRLMIATTLAGASSCSAPVEIAFFLEDESQDRELLVEPSEPMVLARAISDGATWIFEPVDDAPEYLFRSTKDVRVQGLFSRSCGMIRVGLQGSVDFESGELVDLNRRASFSDESLLLLQGQNLELKPFLFSVYVRGSFRFDLFSLLDNPDEQTRGDVRYSADNPGLLTVDCGMFAEPIQEGRTLELQIVGPGTVDVRGVPAGSRERCSAGPTPCAVTGFDEYEVSIPAVAGFQSMTPIDAGDTCSYTEQTQPDADPRVFRVEAGRCRLVLGSGWTTRFTLNPESADYVIRTSAVEGTVVPTADPRVFRTGDSYTQDFIAWVVDVSENPPVELTLANPQGDCVLAMSGRLQLQAPEAGEDATCRVDVSRPMMVQNRLQFSGRGMIEVQPGPDGPNQLLDCDLGEDVVCTDRATTDRVPHPLIYSSPTTVSVRAMSRVQFSDACETVDETQSIFEVEGSTACNVVPVMSSEDGAMDIGFTDAGGSVVLSVPGGAEVDRCDYLVSDAVPGCALSALPHRLDVRAVPDGPYTEFVGFSPGAVDGSERFGCMATTNDTFAVNLSEVAPGVPPSRLIYTCDAEFSCTAQAALEQVELVVVDENGTETTVPFDLTSATMAECPFQTSSFWRCVGRLSADELPDPYTLVTRATSKAPARLPAQFSSGPNSVDIGTLTPAGGVGQIQATVNHCGVRYAFEIEVQ